MPLLSPRLGGTSRRFAGTYASGLIRRPLSTPSGRSTPRRPARCAWNCGRCGSGILIRFVSSMARANYLYHFAVLQVQFHAATAYDIIRCTGVNLGKLNHLGQMPRKIDALIQSIESTTGAVTLVARWVVGVAFAHSLNHGWHGSVSCRRSSNWTCGTIVTGAAASIARRGPVRMARR
jgi:hypothetical protein